MKFERYFTLAPATEWEYRDAKIVGEDGVVFEQKGVEVPKFWSDNALNIVARLYFKVINGEKENSVRSMVGRVVGTIAEWGLTGGYFDNHFDYVIFKEELTWLLIHQYACFNSPIWFNFGVPNTPQQAAACFLMGLEDNTDSIINWSAIESRIFRGGSGSGANVSKLRRKNAPLSTGGKSSGPLSFMKGADCNAGIWKSGGKNRRAATFRGMDAEHDDIEAFINCKVDEEKKAKILIEAGYDDAIDGEAYGTVAFQNMNHSIRVSDDFMTDATATDIGNIENRAKKILRMVAECAWATGDPGIQYKDTINYWNTLAQSGEITTSNPCGEYLSTNWSSCLLASFNLVKYYGKEGFDFSRFGRAIEIFTTALDIIIDNADYPDPRFKETAHRQRQIGLGYSNLGALLMLSGSPYDSPRGRNFATSITSFMTATSYIHSSLMADKLGAFKDYEKNKHVMLNVIKMHWDCSKEDDNWDHLWQKAYQGGAMCGYRNAVTSLVAPTGTISFMMDCDTTGIESEIALIKYKKLVGGGVLKLVNSTVATTLDYLQYTETQKHDILEYIKEHETVEDAPYLKEEHVPIFDCSLKAPNATRFIPYKGHLAMMAAVQPYLSMGISKTVNMPKEATVDDVLQVYIDGWKMKLKSIAIYRDGSKAAQPLNVGKKKAAEIKPKDTRMRQSLPAERNSITHKLEISGFEGYLHVGLDDAGKPLELFIQGSKQGSTVGGLLDSFAIAVSFALQYGAPLPELIDKFTNSRFEPAGFTKHPEIRMATSITDYIFRWMKFKFIDNKSDTKPETSDNSHGVICRSCGEIMERTGTCFTCRCGESKGGCGG